MSRHDPVQGCHATQKRYTVDRQGEARIVADDSKITAPITVIVTAYMAHREAAQLLMKLAREIAQQP